MLALVRARCEEKRDQAERRRDEQHDDVFGRRQVECDGAEVDGRPVRELHVAGETRLEARILEVMRVRDVRGDDVLIFSFHMRAAGIRAASMRTEKPRNLRAPP